MPNIIVARHALCALLAALSLGPSVHAQRPALTLGVSVNGAGAAEIAAGWPLILTASVCAQRDAVPDLPVPAAGWADAFHRSVADASGQLHEWPFEPGAGPSGVVSFAAGCSGRWVWALTPEAAAALAPGAYRVTVVLDAGGQPLQGQPLHVDVHAALPETPVRTADRLLLLADAAEWSGDSDAARAYVEALVMRQPAHPGARLRQAAAHAAAGRPVDALRSIESALSALPEAQQQDEPPTGLLYAREEYLAAAESATRFVVRLLPKTGLHPLAGQGSDEAFVIDGIETREPLLRRGVTYTFQMEGVPARSPFYLTTDPEGAGSAPYTEGISGAPAAGDDVLSFTPGDDTPDLLYYASATKPYAGWRLLVETASVSEPPPDEESDPLTLSAPSPNPSRGPVRLTLSLAHAERVDVVAVDLLGRRVATLLRGALDAGVHPLTLDTARLAPGLYIVRAVGDSGVAVSRRVTVIR